MKEYNTIIWDFNGTIIDDVNAALGAVNDMLVKRKQRIIDLQQYRDAIDIPIWKFYLNVFEDGTITQEEAIVEFDLGVDKHLQKNPLMADADKVLEHFNALHKHQIIVSSSHIDKVTKQLEALGVSKYFAQVLALSDYYAGDKTYLAQEYLESHCVDPQKTVVIGDCVADFRMAAALGCDCILNTKGHQSTDALLMTGAVIINSLSELVNIIK